MSDADYWRRFRERLAEHGHKVRLQPDPNPPWLPFPIPDLDELSRGPIKAVWFPPDYLDRPEGEQ